MAPRVAVRRFNWASNFHKDAALTYARGLELLPTPMGPRYEPTWAALVGGIASAMLQDISPEFYQACLRACKAGSGPLLALPLHGRLGWRRRARHVGCL